MTNGVRFRRVSGAGPTTTARSYADTTARHPRRSTSARSGARTLRLVLDEQQVSRVMRRSERNIGPRICTCDRAWYRFGTQRIVLCVQIVPELGHMGRIGRSGTHLHQLPVGWGPKGRWFKSSRPDETEPAPAGAPAPRGVAAGFAASDRRGGLGLAPRHRAGLSARSGSLGCYAPRAGASESRLIRDDGGTGWARGGFAGEAPRVLQGCADRDDPCGAGRADRRRFSRLGGGTR